MLHKKQDYNYLLAKGNACYKILDVYTNIQDEIIDVFGVSSEYMSIFKKQMNISLMKSEILQTGSDFLDMEIEILEDEIKQVIEKQTEGDLFKIAKHIEKIQGVKIDLKTISIHDFYQYIDIINEK